MQFSSLLTAFLLSFYALYGARALPAAPNAHNATTHVLVPAPSGLTIPLEWGGKGTQPSITLQIGSPGKEYKMAADTGSDSFWVLSESGVTLMNAGVAPRQSLGESSSTSFEIIDKSKWSTVYADGSLAVAGTVARDYVTFAGQRSRIPIGVVDSPGGFATFPFDGVFGFEPGMKPTRGMEWGTTPFRLMAASNTISPVTGWKYPSGTSSKGEVTIGWVNPADFKAGTEVEFDSLEDDTWAITISGIRVGNDDAAVIETSITAMLDTGSRDLIVPPGESDPLLEAIPGFQNVGGQKSIPCDTSVDVSFQVGEKFVSVQGSDIVGAPISEGSTECKPDIAEDATLPKTRWILGSSILHNWHVVYDQTGNKITMSQLNE